MRDWVDRYERFLRISRVGSDEAMLRLRATWLIGSILAGTQVLNIGVLLLTYGRWTYDATISLTAVLIVVTSLQMIRWYADTRFYALFYSALTILATYGSALPEKTGIHTAFLPFVALGPMINGFIAGKRAAMIFLVVILLALGGLLAVSLSVPPAMGDTYAREYNRFAQASFAATLGCVMAVMLSEQIISLLSEQRIAARRARSAEAAKSEFLATMSHELRTPLNGVIGLAEALSDARLEAPERKLVETIRDSGEGLLRILNDLLDLSKIEAGKLTITPRPFALRPLVLAIVDGWREAGATKSVDLSLRIDGPVPDWLIGDDLRLRQILQNLVSNAIKFTDSGGVSMAIGVEAATDEAATLAFRVTDNGPGIPPGAVERIFAPFEQAEAGTTRRYGGTGLGLPICRMLAGLMEGTIGVERTDETGSTFKLVLPFPLAAEAPAPAPSAHAPDPDKSRRLAGVRVLVAEDHPVNRLVVGEFLKAAGAETVFAEDGALCLEALEAATFDVILMDKHMPLMSGIEVTRAIRAGHGAQSDIPIIAVTADAMTGEREALLAVGMDDFVTKPLKADVLIEAIERNVAAPSAPESDLAPQAQMP